MITPEQSVKSLLAALAAALFTCTSWAALGGRPDGLGTLVAPAVAGSVSSGSASFNVLQRQLDSGTTVLEYVDGGGTVFAVSWSGPFLPDLKEILGVHFDTMAARAGDGRGASRSRLTVRRSDVVILSSGRMGAFEGRAWLPSKLPAGFDVNAARWPS